MDAEAPFFDIPFETRWPIMFGSLALIPLVANRDVQRPYVCLDEAVARGVAITEVDEHGTVPMLRVANVLDVDVLVYEGEEVVGGKQDRIFGRSMLLPAGATSLVPVSSAELGRWAYGSPAFAPVPRVAHPELRRVRLEDGGQAEIRAELAAKARRLDAESPAGASEQLYAGHAPAIDAYVDAFPRIDGQCGSIVCVAGQIVCLDFVGRADVYAGLHAKLLRGYALDAIEHRDEAVISADDVSILRYEVLRAKRWYMDAVGLGKEWRFSTGRYHGTQLVKGGELIAMSFFPRARKGIILGE